ncbi:19849_t:CDS:2 [Racocetra fulgida]|uniref:19849_t:CDS:1 n=1 Tax=Racocetra fulgida TaxID=60492 RepID=A0A9N8YUF7_9GLOM|nr:19849_t:CDS:2 [Racocetra fulgida]
MGRNRHKWSKYFKILDEFANKSNKAAIYYACLEALSSEAKKITNKANLCYNHLKSCLYFAQKYTTEELEKILQIENESNEEFSEEDSIKKTNQIEDDDIVVAFKLANPAIQLPSCRKLSGSILKKEILVTNIENLTNPDDKKFPTDIAKIINNSTFWNDLKELDNILLPFCATLNKLHCESARLCDIMHTYA